MIGRFRDKPRDVCGEYYRRGKSPPYLALARCGDDLGDAMNFTAAWGPLGQNRSLPPQFDGRVFTQPWLGDGKDFCEDLTGWVHLKRRFDRLIALAERNTSAVRRDVAEFFREEGSHQR